MIRIPLLICVLTAPTQAQMLAEANWTLTESSLVHQLKTTAPNILRANEAFYSSKFDELERKTEYQLNWVNRARYQDSDEKAIAAFIPTFGPTYRFSTGLQKWFQGGVALSADVFTDQQSSTDGVIDEATRTGVAVGLSIDLWKNLFGRVDSAEVENLVISRKRRELETSVSRRVVELELRKIYWALVANAEKTKVTEGLLQTARQQLNDGIKRQTQFIADKGEIARYRAQVESREASLNALKFERGLLIQALKNQLPELADKEIALGPYDTEAKVREVVACTHQIKAQKQIPWANTPMDEIVGLIEETYKNKQAINRRHSDVDVKLDSRFQMSGVDQGYSASYEDFTDAGKTGMEVGLTLTVPLGRTQSGAREAKEQRDYYAFLADKQKLLAEAQSRHTQIVYLVSLLQSSIHNLQQNSDNLKISIGESQKKFRQARISLNDLVNEQDSLLSSLLTEIDTKLEVINVLLDYFQIFTDDPCSINKVGA